LKIEEGVTGLIGPNGAGKSTLIKLMLGLIKPTSGEIRVFGLDPWAHGEDLRRKIGILHEKPIFPKWATGYDLLKLVSKIREVSNIDKEVKETLTNVGLWDARYIRIGEYSAGMIQRLGIAQALIGTPELIILDEPTANLDPKVRVDVLDLLKIVRDRGSSILISTHVLAELEKLCESIIVIEGGVIRDSGNLKGLAKKYYAYSFAIKSSNQKEIADALSNINYVKDITLRKDEILVRTSSPEELLEWLNHQKTKIETFHIKEEPGLLERIYFEATKQEKI